MMTHEPRYRRSGSQPAAKRRRFRLPYPVAYIAACLAGMTMGTALGSVVNAWLYGAT